MYGVEAAQAGFTEFYAAARDSCLSTVTVLVGDHQLAEELVAEAFSRAWLSWKTVSRHPAPEAWVVRVALNLHVSRWRHLRRETLLLGEAKAEPSCQDHPEPEDDLLSAVRQLPPRQREVIALRVLLDLDAATTAKALDISPKTVGVHLHRALARLRTKIPARNQQETLQ
ncbi:MAG: SigE family RNA polymerase sigma factor [Acidimicrobiales bacterium]